MLFEIIIATLIPWVELRGSIPLAIGMGMDPLSAFILCTATNIALIPFVFLFLKYIFPYFEHWEISQTLLRRIRGKSQKYVEKYGALGLVLFVAIPLPGTGAYSGALAAYVFGVKKRHAVPSIALGVIIAGALVTALSLSAFELLF